jgi:aspartate/methionine/tyrosine aminotransferase
MALNQMYRVLRSLGESGFPLDTGDPHGLPFEQFLESYRRHLEDSLSFNHYFGPGPTPDVVDGTRRLMTHFGLLSHEEAERFDVVVGAGTLHLYEMICRELIEQPGDAIAVPVPTYGLMIPQIEEAGGVPLLIPGRGRHRLVDLERAIEKYNQTGRVVGLLYINPNAYGYGYGAEEVEALARMCGRHDITLIEDLAFYPLAAQRARTPIVSALAKGCKAVTLMGFSKPFGLANARLSLALAPPALARTLIGRVQTSIGFVSRPLLQAFGEMLSGDFSEMDRFLYRNNQAYQLGRKVMLYGLEGETSTRLSAEEKRQCAELFPEAMRARGLSEWLDLAHDPEWGMFVIVDCSKLIARVAGVESAMDVFELLATKFGVRSIPGEVMGTHRPELRLSFSCELDLLVEALVTLYKGLREACREGAVLCGVGRP